MYKVKRDLLSVLTQPEALLVQHYLHELQYVAGFQGYLVLQNALQSAQSQTALKFQVKLKMAFSMF